MHFSALMTKSLLRSICWLALPSAAFLAAACNDSDFISPPDGEDGAGASNGGQHSGGASSGGKGSGQAGKGSGKAGTGNGGDTQGEAGSAGNDNGDTGGVSGSATAGRGGAQGHAGGAGAGGVHAVAGAGGTNAVAGAGGVHAVAGAGGTNAVAGAGGTNAGAGGALAGAGGSAGNGGAVQYLGPSVGIAKSFAALAYSAITTANISPVIGGDIGVSASAVSSITGFDSPLVKKFGIDSLAPNDHLTMLAQQSVTALVGNIDPRPCDADYTNVVGGLTGDITLNPGVTCMNSFSSDVLLNGHVTLDAHGDPNAFFIIRGNLTLTVADGAQVVLSNGAQACGVFWRINKQVTIGKTVQFYGNVIAGSAITMKTGSTLVGRALARTEGVHFDANTVTVPSDGLVGSASVCTHLQ